MLPPKKTGAVGGALSALSPDAQSKFGAAIQQRDAEKQRMAAMLKLAQQANSGQNPSKTPQYGPGGKAFPPQHAGHNPDVANGMMPPSPQQIQELLSKLGAMGGGMQLGYKDGNPYGGKLPKAPNQGGDGPVGWSTL